MTPAESQIAGLLAPLIAQGGTVALLVMFVLALFRGLILSRQHHEDVIALYKAQHADDQERIAAGIKREAELLDLAFTGTQLAEQANDLRRTPQPTGRHPS